MSGFVKAKDLIKAGLLRQFRLGLLLLGVDEDVKPFANQIGRELPATERETPSQQ